MNLRQHDCGTNEVTKSRGPSRMVHFRGIVHCQIEERHLNLS